MPVSVMGKLVVCPKCDTSGNVWLHGPVGYRCELCGHMWGNNSAPPPPEQVRGSTHGDYNQMSVTAQAIKAIMHQTPNWDKMRPAAREALDLTATKQARILHGDFSCYDHWDDIRGYAQLVLDRMIKPTGG